MHALLDLLRQPARSSADLAQRLHVSQQTGSRWLSQLRKDGLVAKNKEYAPTAAGRVYFSGLSSGSNRIVGTLFRGVGEGKYYLSKKGYQRQFQPLLGFTPFPGTMNLRLSENASLASSAQLRQKPGRPLVGFTETNRTYGGARCYPCRIGQKAAGAIIVPDRTHYPQDVVEVLAPVFLRKHLRLKDGDVVELQLD